MHFAHGEGSITKTILGLSIFAAMIGLGLYTGLQPPRFSGWTKVVVESGQSEWLLGEHYCPQAETPYVVAAIEARNHTNGDIQPGQVLWVPTQAS